MSRGAAGLTSRAGDLDVWLPEQRKALAKAEEMVVACFEGRPVLVHDEEATVQGLALGDAFVTVELRGSGAPARVRLGDLEAARVEWIKRNAEPNGKRTPNAVFELAIAYVRARRQLTGLSLAIKPQHQRLLAQRAKLDLDQEALDDSPELEKHVEQARIDRREETLEKREERLAEWVSELEKHRLQHFLAHIKSQQQVVAYFKNKYGLGMRVATLSFCINNNTLPRPPGRPKVVPIEADVTPASRAASTPASGSRPSTGSPDSVFSSISQRPHNPDTNLSFCKVATPDDLARAQESVKSQVISLETVINMAIERCLPQMVEEAEQCKKEAKAEFDAKMRAAKAELERQLSEAINEADRGPAKYERSMRNELTFLKTAEELVAGTGDFKKQCSDASTALEIVQNVRMAQRNANHSVSQHRVEYAPPSSSSSFSNAPLIQADAAQISKAPVQPSASNLVGRLDAPTSIAMETDTTLQTSPLVQTYLTLANLARGKATDRGGTAIQLDKKTVHLIAARLDYHLGLRLNVGLMRGFVADVKRATSGGKDNAAYEMFKSAFKMPGQELLEKRMALLATRPEVTNKDGPETDLLKEIGVSSSVVEAWRNATPSEREAAKRAATTHEERLAKRRKIN